MKMKLWILCSADSGLPARCASEALDHAAEALPQARAALPENTGRPLNPQGLDVYCSSWAAARQTAEALVPGAEAQAEPELDEIPLRAGLKSRLALPLWFWLLLARLQRLFGASRQPESRRAALARAERLLDRLEGRGRDCVLVTHPLFLAVLLDRLAARGYVAARREILGFKPGERILVTDRRAHCGGCRNNCLLANPGCGVGRDKAARHSG